MSILSFNRLLKCMRCFELKQVTKVYSAKSYTPESPRTGRYVAINCPEYLPTVPQDDKQTETLLAQSYFLNQNFPATQVTVTQSHYIELPLLQGSRCPAIFPKGTQFLLLCPTEKIEEGYLLYI